MTPAPVQKAPGKDRACNALKGYSQFVCEMKVAAAERLKTSMM
jgi:hypothetical protein